MLMHVTANRKVGGVVGFFELVKETEEKIASFAELEAGWHYGRGNGVPREIIDAAVTLLFCFVMAGFKKTDAFPGVDGEVMVTAYDGDHAVSVTVERDRTYTISHEIGKEERLYEPGLSEVDAYRNLLETAQVVMGQECLISFSSTSNTSIRTEASSLISLSNRQVTEAEPQSFWKNVASRQTVRSAPTLRSTMPVWVGTQRSFGALKRAI